MHKHSEVIKAWADGVQIQYLSTNRKTWCDWNYSTSPSWHPSAEYRIKPVPHKWQKEMDAAKAGKTIQWCGPNEVKWNDWLTAAIVGPDAWGLRGYKFRIKPEIVEVLFTLGEHGCVRHPMLAFEADMKANVRAKFEDGKLISAEVL